MKTRNVIGISNESSAFWIVFWGTNGVSYSWALWRWDKPSGHFRGYTPFSGKNHIGGFISHENPTSEKERFLLPSFLLVKSYIFMPRLLVVHPHIIYIYYHIISPCWLHIPLSIQLSPHVFWNGKLVLLVRYPFCLIPYPFYSVGKSPFIFDQLRTGPNHYRVPPNVMWMLIEITP